MKWHEVLEVKENAGKEEIETSYNLHIVHWHPDKYKGGLHEDFAKEIFEKILKAYKEVARKLAFLCDLAGCNLRKSLIY